MGLNKKLTKKGFSKKIILLKEESQSDCSNIFVKKYKIGNFIKGEEKILFILF
jgi:hypothetical protein